MTLFGWNNQIASSVASNSPSTGCADWPPRGGCNLRNPRRHVRVLRAIALSSCAHTHARERFGIKPKRAGSRQRNILWIISLFIVATKICPISSAMPKSRDVASRASTSIAGEGSGISLVCSLPRRRNVMANSAGGAVRAAGCDTSFCSRVCAMPTEPGAGIRPVVVWDRCPVHWAAASAHHAWR